VRRFVAAATSLNDQIGLRWTVGGGGETSGRRRGHAGSAAAASRAEPDGPPTDSERAKCSPFKTTLFPITYKVCYPD